MEKKRGWQYKKSDHVIGKFRSASVRLVGRNAKMHRIKIRVKDVFYPPKVSVEVDPHRSAVHEGGRITLKCILYLVNTSIIYRHNFTRQC